jgi:hypothetical protein
MQCSNPCLLYPNCDIDCAFRPVRPCINGRRSQPTTKVEGSANLNVNVKAPRGTNVQAEADGLFKKVEVNRQTQMEPAKVGPEVDENVY